MDIWVISEVELFYRGAAIQIFSQAWGILKWVGLLEMEGGRVDNSDIKVQCWPGQALIKVA